MSALVLTDTINIDNKIQKFEYDFDNIDALKGFVEQCIICLKKNCELGLLKDLNVTSWNNNNNMLNRQLTAIEISKYNNKEIPIKHYWTVNEKRYY